jgi:phosphate transport system substrate-binding protein
MHTLFRTTIVASALGVLLLAMVFPAAGSDVLRYSSSAQVRDVFQDESLNRFSKISGIEVDLYIGSSASALHRLFNGVSDISSTAESLAPTHADYGYVQTSFCKVPLIVITNVQTPVTDISEAQLRDVFAGTITNWKALGGPDRDIITIVPGKDTAAFKNFAMLALKRFEVKYDFMAYRSTMVVAAVHRIPWSISFIAKGAATRDKAVRIMKVNGRSYADADYPYTQIFSFVTKGAPAGGAKALIDFALSNEVREEFRKNGITPLPE